MLLKILGSAGGRVFLTILLAPLVAFLNTKLGTHLDTAELITTVLTLLGGATLMAIRDMVTGGVTSTSAVALAKLPESAPLADLGKELDK